MAPSGAGAKSSKWRPTRTHVAFYVVVAVISATFITHASTSLREGSFHQVKLDAIKGHARAAAIFLPGLPVVEEVDPGIMDLSDGSQRDQEETTVYIPGQLPSSKMARDPLPLTRTRPLKEPLGERGREQERERLRELKITSLERELAEARMALRMAANRTLRDRRVRTQNASTAAALHTALRPQMPEVPQGRLPQPRQSPHSRALPTDDDAESRASAASPQSAVSRRPPIQVQRPPSPISRSASPPPTQGKPMESKPCVDSGPWECNEDGCPGKFVSCADMIEQCEWQFGRLFIHPPKQLLPTTRIYELCPSACNVCGKGKHSRTYPLYPASNAVAKQSITDAVEEEEYEEEYEEEQEDEEEEQKGGRGVWGAIWKEEAPTGENKKYKPPTSLQAYMKLVDGTSWQNHTKADEKKCTRYFKVGDRGDMRQTVRPMLKELGICDSANHSSVPSVDVMWTRPWEVIAAFFRAKIFHPGVIVNSLAGLPQQIGQKMSLARLHVGCMTQSGYDPLDPIPRSAPFCRFTQRAFAVRRSSDRVQMKYRRFQQYTQQLDEEVAEAHRIWILKPQGGFNQVGIHMYSLAKEDAASEEGILAWLMQRVPEGTWVLQEYIMNPMTYKGHKFDLRVWAVVTSLDPLRMYLLGTGIPKVSAWAFSKAVRDVKEQCMHLLFPGTSACFSDPRAEVLEPYPTRTDVDSWYGAVQPAGERFWTSVVWPSVEWVLVELMVLARSRVLHIDHALKRKSFRYKRIFFLQPDVVLDNKGSAYLVEVNTNGYMIGNLHKTFFPLAEEQRALLQLVGANGFPQQSKYNSALRAQTKSFCAKTRCTPALEREIWEMVHEDMHCTQTWYRIFPTRGDRKYTAKLKTAPQYRDSFTPLDARMFEWLELKWTPRHTHSQGDVIVHNETRLRAR